MKIVCLLCILLFYFKLQVFSQVTNKTDLAKSIFSSQFNQKDTNISENKIISRSQTLESNSDLKKEVYRFHVVDTIGCKDCEHEIFGNLRDINIGPSDSLYVLDWKLRNIRIFDSEGNYGRTIPVPKAVLRPSSIAPRPDGKIYITEQLEGKSAKVFLVDNGGQVVDKFGLHFMPHLVRWKDDALFINSQPYYGNETKWLVHKYDQNGKLLIEFCHQMKDWAKLSKHAGGTNGFLALNNNHVYFAFGSPYDIRSFAFSGDSLNTFIRSPNYFGNLIEKHVDGPDSPIIKLWSGFCLGVVELNSRYLLYFNLKAENDEIFFVIYGQLLGGFWIRLK